MKRLRGALVLVALFLAGCASDNYRYEPPRQPAVIVPSSAGQPAKLRPGSAPGARAPATPGGSVPIANPDEKDSAPGLDEIPANVSGVPDAVPQAEGRSPYGNPSSYEVYGKRYEILSDARGFRERGYASWYGKKFHGKRTSSGVPYNMFAMTGAHKTLPIPSYARVTNVSNGRSVVIKINDRGPFHEGRIVDLSYAAASRLDMLSHGSTLVELEVITPGDSPETTVASAGSAPLPVAAEKPPLPAERPPVVVPQPALVPVGAPRYLQAGLFGDAVNAAAFREKLATAGIKPLLMKSESRNNQWIYRVLIGPFADARQLEAERARLSADATPTIPVID
ncbi:MAG: septal ring lytic transglycosylase RlpA family protein [Nevskia sp.]